MGRCMSTGTSAKHISSCGKFGLRVEDGSSPVSMQHFISNFTAILKLPDNTFEQLPLRQDDASSGRLLSQGTVPLTKAGSYEVLLQYVEPQAEALGLPPTEAALQLRRTFAVSPGPAHELRLGMSVDARKCLNAGRVADRIVLSQTTLSILDRHSNVVTQAGSTAHTPVNIAVLDALGHTAVDSSVIALSSNSIQIPEAVGQVSVSACSISQGQAGSYILELAVSGTTAGAVIHPVRLPFEVIDASEETEAVSTATTAVHGAEHQLTSCKNTAASRSRQLDRAGSQVRPLLAQAQEILSMAVDDTNWEAVRQHCQMTQQQTRIARPAKHQHQLSRHAEQRLRAIPGVFGYVSEFVFVEDETYARLLSWQTSNYLGRLLVEDSATRLRLRDANIPVVGSSPAVLLLSKLRPIVNSTGLPHTDSGCILPGMHDVVRLAQHVCVSIPSDCMPGSSADNRKDATAKLLQAVVGEYLYMPTEAAASQYSEAVFQQLKRPCWPILCQDTGALITSSGLEGGNASHNAPAHLGSLHSYYGQVPREQTQQWRDMTSALGVLQQVAGCIEQKRQAQARCKEADNAVRTAQSHLQQRQDELRAAKAQTAQLQQLLSTANAADATNAQGGMKNGGQASKRNHAAATATDGTAHSPALTSPPQRNKAAKAS